MIDTWIMDCVASKLPLKHSTWTNGYQGVPTSNLTPPTREDQVNFYVVDKSKEATGACLTKRRRFGFLGCCQGLDRSSWCKTDRKLCHGPCYLVFSIVPRTSRLCCRHPKVHSMLPIQYVAYIPVVSRMVATCSRPFVYRDCVAMLCYWHSRFAKTFKSDRSYTLSRQCDSCKEHVLTQ